MITGLLVYLCFDAAMTDCQVFAHEVFWEGPMAPIECDYYRRRNEHNFPIWYNHPYDLLGTQCDSAPSE